MNDTLPAHSDIIGGSTAERRIMCPGSYGLEQTLPKSNDTGSEFAERGTALHEAMEHLLNLEDATDNLLADAETLLNLEFNKFTITRELLDDKILPACRALNEIIAELGGELDMMIEVKASIDSVLPGGFGTIDILGKLKDGRILVLDWKFGDGVPVSVEASYQLGFYAGCALYDPDPEIREMIDCDEALDFIFVIVQPRPSYEDEPDWQKWETTDDWIEDLIDQAVKANDKALESGASIVTGSHCRWCPAKIVCPEHQSKAIDVLDAPKPTTMDAVTLATWLDAADLAEAFIKDIRAHAHTEAERGVKIPGWKCVPKRATRKYIDDAAETAAAKVLVRKLKKVGAYSKPKLLTPPQAEKALGKKEYEKLLTKFVTKVSSGTTLARDTDSRPDVSGTSKALAGKLQGIAGEAEDGVFTEIAPPAQT